VSVPKILHADDHLLVTQEVRCQPPQTSFWQNLAHDLAQAHQQQKDQFGYDRDNWIGAGPQINQNSLNQKLSWGEFFWQYRISIKLDELQLERRVEFDPKLILSLQHNCIDQLNQFDSQACLLHGDLWSGNVLCSQDQESFFIDPAVYYGDREADIAMTQCFGGFAPEFYQTYESLMPLQSGYHERRHIYNLYHMLNHWIIFGDSYAHVTKGMITSIARP
jgi:protein-ribulosamine 3-kinase